MKYQSPGNSRSAIAHPLVWVIWSLATVPITAVLLPSIYLIVWAFWGTETIGVLNVRPSTKWFASVLQSSDWRASISYSATLGAAVSALGCVVVCIHFYAMRFSDARLERTLYLAAFVPFLVPAVVYGLALRLVGARLGLPELAIMVVGHLATVVPLQFFIMESAQETIPTERLHAAACMGATHPQALAFVYLPEVWKTLVASFLVGFFVSFDELVIATMVIDSGTITVPKRLWGEIHRGMEPQAAVIATLLLGVYISVAIVLVSRRRARS